MKIKKFISTEVVPCYQCGNPASYYLGSRFPECEQCHSDYLTKCIVEQGDSPERFPNPYPHTEQEYVTRDQIEKQLQEM